MNTLPPIPLVVSLGEGGESIPGVASAPERVDQKPARFDRSGPQAQFGADHFVLGSTRRRLILGLAACGLCAGGLTFALSANSVPIRPEAPAFVDGPLDSTAASGLNATGLQLPSANSTQTPETSSTSPTDPREFVLTQLREGTFGDELAEVSRPEAIVDSRNGDIVLVRLVDKANDGNTTTDKTLLSVLLVRSAESWNVRETYRT